VRVDEELRRFGQVLHELDRLAPEELAQLRLSVGPEGARQREQLDRVLGQALHAAAAERLAGGDLAAGQRDHRLEAPS
jgi:hypothetical protein